MCKQTRILKFAVKQAKNNDTLLHHKHAAVVDKGSWIVSIGHNHWKSQDNSIHAEVHAIRCAERYLDTLEGCTLYVARYCKSKIGLSKPCEECREAIFKSGIKNVVYTESSLHGEEMRYTKVELHLVTKKKL